MKYIKVDGGLLVNFTLWTTISQMKCIKVDGRLLVSFTLWTTISEIPVFPSLFKVVVSEWKSLSRVQLFATPWTLQTMVFSRPEYWSG